MLIPDRVLVAGVQVVFTVQYTKIKDLVFGKKVCIAFSKELVNKLLKFIFDGFIGRCIGGWEEAAPKVDGHINFCNLDCAQSFFVVPPKNHRVLPYALDQLQEESHRSRSQGRCFGVKVNQM